MSASLVGSEMCIRDRFSTEFILSTCRKSVWLCVCVTCGCRRNFMSEHRGFASASMCRGVLARALSCASRFNGDGFSRGAWRGRCWCAGSA
eukprot:2095288-Alexandrium_andersonii.AAC.1